MTTGIALRLPGGEWTTVSLKEARRDLMNSIDFINRYDLIETPASRMQRLDLAIPAFLEAVPKFKDMFTAMDGVGGNPTIEEHLAGITSALKALPTNVDIWDWRDTRGHRAALGTAFASCRVRSYANAMFTKLLHKKRPQLIPPIDSRFRAAWVVPYRNKWTIQQLVDVTFDVGRELGNRPASRERLRSLADSMGPPYSELTTLRLYDILSWWKGDAG